MYSFRTMAPLEKAFFAGQDALPDGDVKRAEVANFTTGPAEALKRFGWKGTAASCVGLRLTDDNRRIEGNRTQTGSSLKLRRSGRKQPPTYPSPSR
jgi:hypothetical protein